MLRITRRHNGNNNLYFCKKCKDTNFIIECKCGCGKTIQKRDRRCRLREYKKGHDKKGKPFLFAVKGLNHYKWKGGRKKHENYIMILMPDYFSAQRNGYVHEHIYNFQEYHQCCLLPWGVVHHIIPVSEDYCNNMPWNLMGMMKTKHTSFHKHLVYVTTDSI